MLAGDPPTPSAWRTGSIAWSPTTQTPADAMRDDVDYVSHEQVRALGPPLQLGRPAGAHRGPGCRGHLGLVAGLPVGHGRHRVLRWDARHGLPAGLGPQQGHVDGALPSRYIGPRGGGEPVPGRRLPARPAHRPGDLPVRVERHGRLRGRRRGAVRSDPHRQPGADLAAQTDLGLPADAIWIIILFVDAGTAGLLPVWPNITTVTTVLRTLRKHSPSGPEAGGRAVIRRSARF